SRPDGRGFTLTAGRGRALMGSISARPPSPEARPLSVPPPGAAPALPLLRQREIEARIVGPLLRAVCAELGAERTLALARSVIEQLARESGAELARALGEATLETFAQ